MMMYPPAMPMPSVPMPPMGGYPGGMLGGMPGGMPAGGMPMGGMMPGMAEHMAMVEKLLHEIHQCCEQTSTMVKEIYMKMAKG
jgi:predicted lipid-binding transport protein (Tim44 family)